MLQRCLRERRHGHPDNTDDATEVSYNTARLYARDGRSPLYAHACVEEAAALYMVSHHKTGKQHTCYVGNEREVQPILLNKCRCMRCTGTPAT